MTKKVHYKTIENELLCGQSVHNAIGSFITFRTDNPLNFVTCIRCKYKLKQSPGAML